MTDSTPIPAERDVDRGARRLAYTVIIGFIIFSGLLYFHRNETDTEWNRLVFIFGAIEAIGFSAFGFIWGKEVHRERAEKAEEQASAADTNEKTATKARARSEAALTHLVDFIDVTAKGKTLGSAVTNIWGRDLGVQAEVPGLGDLLSRSSQSTTADPDWAQLREVAHRLKASVANP